MDFGWQTWTVIVVGVILVALFLGPGMWSSSPEFLGVTLWRWWRSRRARSRGASTEPTEKSETPSP
jgi:hypothetical protein